MSIRVIPEWMSNLEEEDIPLVNDLSPYQVLRKFAPQYDDVTCPQSAED